jgi:serine/threonine protein kinase
MSGKRNRPLPEGYRLAGYRLLGLLARGGFSFVYLAEDLQGNRFAIKEYLPAALSVRTADEALVKPPSEADAAAFRSGLRCFFEEARLLASLAHPNLVRVLNFFRANDTAYMVMRYEEGRSLKESVLQAPAPPPERWLCSTFAQLLAGLRAVHAYKLLHLDIKPANIYLREDGDPVLIDFGGSRRAFERGGPALPVVYTRNSAPPELLRDPSKLGPWSDLYSIGATLYACLFTQSPPPSDERLAKDRYVPARRAGAKRYSAGLLDLVDACLRLEPTARPQSVHAVQKALAALGCES